MFEISFTKEGAVSRKAVFEGGFKFAVSEARKKFYSTASKYQGAIGEISRRNWLVIGEREISGGL